MWVLLLGNYAPPQKTAISTGHDEIALPSPFCGEFALLPDGNVARFGGKQKILSGTSKIPDGFHVIIIIFRMIQSIKSKSFIRGIMCLPSYSQVFCVSSIGPEMIVINYRPEFSIGNGII